jgi:hypothetical protein
VESNPGKLGLLVGCEIYFHTLLKTKISRDCAQPETEE